MFVEILTGRKLKMSALFLFEIKCTKKDKIFNFLQGYFSIMGGPMNMIFGMFSKTNARLLKSVILQSFSKYSKGYNNLNVKSGLKLNGP